MYQNFVRPSAFHHGIDFTYIQRTVVNTEVLDLETCIRVGVPVGPSDIELIVSTRKRGYGLKFSACPADAVDPQGRKVLFACNGYVLPSRSCKFIGIHVSQGENLALDLSFQALGREDPLVGAVVHFQDVLARGQKHYVCLGGAVIEDTRHALSVFHLDPYAYGKVIDYVVHYRRRNIHVLTAFNGVVKLECYALVLRGSDPSCTVNGRIVTVYRRVLCNISACFVKFIPRLHTVCQIAVFLVDSACKRR